MRIYRTGDEGEALETDTIPEEGEWCGECGQEACRCPPEEEDPGMRLTPRETGERG